MSYLGAVIRHVGTIPVLVAFEGPYRLTWWRRWSAYAPGVLEVGYAYGLTKGHAEVRLRSRLIDHYLAGAR